MLPDEIISEILSPALNVSDERFAATERISPFATYSVSSSAYLLVCKAWLRVATPLLYRVVVLRSTSQANALEETLQDHPELGRFIKKLRVEGGYGPAMHTILQAAPNIQDLFVSLSIWSTDRTAGLRNGLALLNPRRVIIDDPSARDPPHNKQLDNLMQTLWACIRTWDNLKIFSMPYGFGSEEWRSVRARNFISSLEECASVHTIQLTGYFSKFHEFLRLLPDISSLEIVEFTDSTLRPAINRIPELKALAQFKPNLVFQPTPSTTKISIPTRPIASSFIPMSSVSEETRESIWSRIFFFALSIDEPCISTPVYSRRPCILRVSKLFYRIALPHLYHSLHLTPKNAVGVATQLQHHKDKDNDTQIRLGPYIHSIRSFHAPTVSLLAILSHAPNLRFLLVSEWGEEFQRGVESLPFPALHTLILPPYLRDPTSFLLFLKTGGGTLRRLLLPEDLDKDTPPILDLCPNLVQLEFRGEYDVSQTAVKNEHRALRSISAMRMPPKLTNLDVDKFPALKEIRLRHLEWPTTERELAKNNCVAIAESLAEMGVAVIGLSGRPWVTRVRRGRRVEGG
ncbi:F-box domain-containing protein [Favolaschia claudopus]|uniref:F-box domain-containing protein n=1 Tax=Favolaschia claudopus TaxID=2862362 RepID=A0AAW0A5V6_9AGAR